MAHADARLSWWRVIAVATAVVALVAVAGAAVLRPTPAPPDSTPRPSQRFEQLTLERTECFGPCPIYTVSVDRSGRATYRATHVRDAAGEKQAPVQVVRQIQIPQPALRALVSAVESPDFARLDTSYQLGAVDVASVRINVMGGGTTHSTYVTGVPCRSRAGRAPASHATDDPSLVPDIFCSVADLVDIASCAHYWGARTPVYSPTRSTPRPPPRCRPTP